MSDANGIYLRAYVAAKDSLQGTNAESFGLWWYLVLSAAIRPQVLPGGRVLERGQVIVSCRGLEERLKMPRSSVSRYLNLWREDGAIRFEKLGRNGTIVTLCQFDTYQPLGRDAGTKDSHEPATRKPRASHGASENRPKQENPKNPKNPKNPEPRECAPSAAPAAEPEAPEDPTAEVGDESLRRALQGWRAYKAKRRERYLPESLAQFCRKAQREAATYGAEAVAGLIGDTIGNGYQGVPWDQLERNATRQRGSPPASNGLKPGYRDPTPQELQEALNGQHTTRGFSA